MTNPATYEKPAIGAIAPWFGAKRQLADVIVHQLGPHRAYWEPFCGSMAVLLAKPPSTYETVSDLHEDLLNLAHVLRDDLFGPLLFSRLEGTLAHEALFAEAESVIAGSTAPWTRVLTKESLDRAYYFFVSSWLGRNGVIGTKRGTCGGKFAACFTSKGGSHSIRFGSAIAAIPQWANRLRGVTILNRDGLAILEKIEDADGTVIYCDPPYEEKGAAYLHDFKPIDHERLATFTRRFRRTRVVISYYDHPAVRARYGGWSILECPTHRNISRQIAPDKQRSEPKPVAPEILLINGPIYGPATEFNLDEKCTK